VKKPLHIQILEAVEASNTFPIIDINIDGFTRTEITSEVIGLDDGLLLSAQNIIDIHGVPSSSSIRRITPEGRLYLEKWRAEEKARNSVKKLSKWAWAAIIAASSAFILGIIGAIGTHLGDQLWYFLKNTLHLH